MSSSRAAVLIGGRILTFDKVVETWNSNLFAVNSNVTFDLFISVNSRVACEVVDVDAIISKAKLVLNPNVSIKYIVQDYAHTDERIAFNIMSMYWHNKKAFEMISSDTAAYDYVIKWRADIVLQSSLILPTPIQLSSNTNTIYIPNGKDWGGLNDQIAAGSYAAMKEYCALIDHIDVLWPVRHPERLLKKYLTSVVTPAPIIERLRFKWALHADRNATVLYANKVV